MAGRRNAGRQKEGGRGDGTRTGGRRREVRVGGMSARGRTRERRAQEMARMCRPDVLMAIDEGCGKVADTLLVAILRYDDGVLPDALKPHERV